MNMIEIGRLVRRITSALKGELDAAMAPKLAEDFTALCASTNLRLEQCLSMIEAGSATQAVQLAETPPHLLDLVTLLEFRQADEWRQYCASKSLSCAEKLNSKAVAALNDCYNRGITPQHPVYGAYRAAVLAKNDEAALTALKSIVRLNPADGNAAAELSRLDAKILAARLTRLEKLLATNTPADAAAVISELDNIEGLGFKSEIGGPAWQRAQLIRCEKLLAEAEARKAAGELGETGIRLDYLDQLKADHKLTWPAGWGDRIASLRSWCHTETATRQDGQDHEELVGQLKRALQMSREKEKRSNAPRIPELQKDLAELHRLFGQVEAFPRPVPEELRLAFGQQATRLEAGISGLYKKKRMRMVIGVATAAVILMVMALAFIALQRSNALTEELKKAVNQHQVRSLENLLKQAGGTMILPTPRLKSACLAATAEINRQYPGLLEYQAAFKKLPVELNGYTTIKQFDEVAENFSTAQHLQHALIGDLQTEMQAGLDGFRTRWVNHCTESLPALNQQFDEALTAQENAVAKFNAATDLDHFRDGIATAAPRGEEISRSINNLTTFVKPQANIVDRSDAVQRKIRNAQGDLMKIESAIGSLKQATSLADYIAAVSMLANFPSLQVDYARISRQADPILELRDDPGSLVRSLLTGTNQALWTTLKQDHAATLIPAKVTADARQRFVELARDYAVSGNYHQYHLCYNAQGDDCEDYIASDLLQIEGGWHLVPMWKVDPKGSCNFQRQEYGFFDGHFKLSTSKVVDNYQTTDLTGVTSAWRSSGLDRLVDPRTLKFTVAPLKVADSLCSITNASPLFRVYLLKQLVAMMNLQPEESGLRFAPQLQALPETLPTLGAGELASGDWFVAARKAALEPELNKYLQALQADPFMAQAAKVMAALDAAQRADFAFAGHISPDGDPEWLDKPASGYVWGFPEGKSDPGLIYSVHDGRLDTVNKPSALTPLLLFKGDLPAIVTQSGIRAGDPKLKNLLPPLFSVLPLP